MLMMLAWGAFVCGQEVASPETANAGDALQGVASPDATSQNAVLQGDPLRASSSQEETKKGLVAPCLEPPRLLRWQDYQGLFQSGHGILSLQQTVRFRFCNAEGALI